jgi:hypothetical protein
MGPNWQTLRYCKVANIISSTLNLTFSSIQSSLVFIQGLAQMSWRRSSFRELTAVQSHTGTWPVSYITVATAETHHPPPHIRSLVSANIQQASIKSTGAILSAWWNSMTPLLHTHFYVRCHFARRLLCCCCTTIKFTNYWRKKLNILGGPKNQSERWEEEKILGPAGTLTPLS